MILIFRFCLLILFIGLPIPSDAQWKTAEMAVLGEQNFQIKVENGQPFYFCRDQDTNFGFATRPTGCHLIYGTTVLAKNYEVLMDPEHNLGWKRVSQSKIPIGAFDAGRSSLLGEKHLCLKTQDKRHYPGMVLKKQCHYRVKGRIRQSSNFQILIHLWAKTSKIPLDLPASGKDASGDRYICRVQQQGIYIPGTIGRGERMCQFIDSEGEKIINVDNYEVQLYLPSRWVQKKAESIFKQAIVAGQRSPYFICRAPLRNNLYIGKTQKGDDFCTVAIGDGHLNLKEYQFQIAQ